MVKDGHSMARRKTFYDVLTDAINHFAENGYTSQKELEDWTKRLKKAADESIKSARLTEVDIRRMLNATYRRLVTNKGILKLNKGLDAFTLDKLKPAMRRELSRRILSSANLIKLNREEAISTTLRRFQGWATSVPQGGSDVVNRRAEKESIRKAIGKMGFIERRVSIDQTQKFAAALNEIIARDEEAIAAKWKSAWRVPGYDYREDHKERDEKVYAIRNNWAIREGLMKAGPVGYTDQMTAPGEEVYCSCMYTYFYNLESIPEEMLTAKGRKFIANKKD
jgi:hypothetical protein